jgi:branched-chain amino acid transport system substrate-binding protein
VDAVITGYGDTGADLAAFGQYDVPYFHSDTTRICKTLVREHPEYNNCFMLCDDSAPYGWLGFDIITEEIPYECPNHKAAVIYVDYEYNIVSADTFKEEVAKKGWEIVVDEMVPWGVKDWGPILSKIRATEPSIILFANLIPVDGVTFLHQFLEDPTDSIIYMTYFPAIPEFRELAGEAANGVCWITAMGILPTPEAEAWGERYKQRFGKEPAIFGSAGPYDALHMWAAAVERTGDVEDYDAVCAAIRDPDHLYTGLCGTYKFDPEEQYALGGEALVPPTFYQIQNMKHVLIWPTKFAQGEFEVPPWIGS